MHLPTIHRPLQWAFIAVWLVIVAAVAVYSVQVISAATPLGRAVLVATLLIAMAAVTAYAYRWPAFRILLPLAGLLLLAYACIAALTSAELQDPGLHRAGAAALAAFATISILVGVREKR